MPSLLHIIVETRLTRFTKMTVHQERPNVKIEIAVSIEFNSIALYVVCRAGFRFKFQESIRFRFLSFRIDFFRFSQIPSDSIRFRSDFRFDPISIRSGG